MRYTHFSLRLLFVAILLALPASLQAQLVFTNMEPVGGIEGTSVTLTGTGIDTNASHSVTVDGTPATNVSVTSTSISFTIAPGTSSGEIVVTADGEEFVTATPFEVKRVITGTLTLPDNITHNDYLIHSCAQFDTPNASGEFSTIVSKDSASVVWAFRDNGPNFIAVVTSTDTSVTINATSTARALAFLSPYVATQDDAKATQILSDLDTLPELATLATSIQTRSKDNFDYLDDAVVEAEIEALLTAYLNLPGEPQPALASAFEEDTPDGTHLKLLNPDYSASIPATENRLQFTVVDDPERRPFEFILKVDGKEGDTNPLDWFVEVFEISPQEFPDGLTDIDELTFESTYSLFDNTPAFTGFVRAKLGAQNVDIIGNIASWVTSQLVSVAPDQLKPNEFGLLKDYPTIYAVQAYSGNLWYGTRLLLVNKNQVDILEEIDPNNRWAFSLATNVVIASIDMASVFVSLKDYIPHEKIGGILNTVFKDVSKAIAAYQDFPEGITREIIFDLVKTTAKALMKEATKTANEGILVNILRFTKGTAKTFAKVIDITGKIASVEKSLERAAGFLLPNAIAVERAILVVGEPFQPIIDRITPSTAFEGDEVHIFGHNFGFPLSEFDSDPNEDIEVSFCTFASTTTDPSNPDITSKLVAEIVQRRETLLTVKVPNDWTLGTNETFICVEFKGKFSTSQHLGDEGKFTRIPPPEISGIVPTEIEIGGGVTIQGINFRHDAAITVDNFWTYRPTRVNDNTLHVIFPLPNQGPSIGEHTLKVAVGNSESEAFTFQIGYPEHDPSEPPTAGWGISVTTLTSTIGEDGEISLLEAFLLANGGYGPLEQHQPCESITDPDHPDYCGGPRDLDTDHVFGDDVRAGGVGFRDSISIDSELSDGFFSAGAPLPPIGTGDSWDFNDITIGGSGILIDGASNTTVKNLTLNNPPSDGIRLANDSESNTIRDITIIGPTGNGVSLFNNSSGNDFDDITIEGGDGHGFFIEGDSNFNTINNLSVTDVGGSGIVIETDSTQNTFTFEDQDIDDFTPNISETTSHGVHLKSGADRNRFNNLFIANVEGSGLFFEGDAENNRLNQVVVTNPTLHGLHLSGNNVRYNRSYRDRFGGFSDTDASWDLRDIYRDAGGYGILIDNGANNNLIGPRRVWDNTLGGIKITGEGSENNFIGKQYRRVPFDKFDLIPGLVFNNLGHGVHLGPGASRNTIQLLNVSGNTDDGVHIEGPNTILNHVSGVWTGFQYFVKGTGEEPFGAPNFGSSIHINKGAQDNVIGGFSISRNNFVNDTEYGVLIDGEETSGNVIRHSDIGRSQQTGAFPREYQGVGKSGIALTNGAHDNIIGAEHTDNRLQIDASPDAAILIDNSHSNTVIGCFIGAPHEFVEFEEFHKNRIGIHLTNGSHSNRIGQPGPMLGADPNFLSLTGIIDELNRTRNIREAAIWIENSGGSIDGDGNRINANIIQNNNISSDNIGIKISGTSYVNDIGGFFGGPSGGFISIFEVFTEENNRIQGNEVGLEIDNVVLPSPNHRNRILNNSIVSENEDDSVSYDLTAGRPKGTGVHITNGSSGNILGESFSFFNKINTNRVGVYIDNSNGNIVQGNEISAFTFLHNSLAGVVIRNSSNNLIGGTQANARNILEANGAVQQPDFTFQPSTNPNAAAIVLINSDFNTISSNEIRDTYGDGIRIVDSDNNTVGGSNATFGNIVKESRGNGITVLGANSTGNRIQHNIIGLDGTLTPAGNEEDGIEIKDGASANLIGSNAPAPFLASTINLDTPNTIAENLGHGVQVMGSNTIGNSILFNSIFNNALSGIANETGGNEELPPPTEINYSNTSVSGSVADIAILPEGSIVQIFNDNGSQGEIFLGETNVKAGGAWTLTNLPALVRPNVTATVTHPESGSTSEFASASVTRSLLIERTDGKTPGEQSIPLNEEETPIHVLTLSAIGDPARVNSIALNVNQGSLLDDTEIETVTLFLDTDKDSKISDYDKVISDPVQYDADNGDLSLNLGLVVEPDDPQNVIVSYRLKDTVADGTNFDTKVNTFASVNAEFTFPINQAAVATGIFPILSDLFTIGELADAFAAWRILHFPDQSGNDLISGPLADPDNDNLSNLLEYFLGSIPNVQDANKQPSLLNDGGNLVFSFDRDQSASGVSFNVTASKTLEPWVNDDSLIEDPVTVDNLDGTDTINIQASSLGNNGPNIFLRLELNQP